MLQENVRLRNTTNNEFKELILLLQGSLHLYTSQTKIGKTFHFRFANPDNTKRNSLVKLHVPGIFLVVLSRFARQIWNFLPVLFREVQR